jgi:hypothetical protein
MRRVPLVTAPMRHRLPAPWPQIAGCSSATSPGSEPSKNLLRAVDFSGQDWERARRRACKHGGKVPLAPRISCS